jgi:DNA-binding MarR family transcriptional regulator
MSESDYDRLTDIWGEHSTMTDILDALEKAKLIESYEIKDEEE